MFPKFLSRKVIYESQWINLYVDKVRMPSGVIIEEYHQLNYPKEAVVVLTRNTDQKICMIKALRYTTKEVGWELPSGGIEKDEEMFIAAQREFLEETGSEVTQLKLHYSYNPSNGMSNQNVHILFGESTGEAKREKDQDEVEGVYWLSIEEIQELIGAKEIHDGVNSGLVSPRPA